MTATSSLGDRDGLERLLVWISSRTGLSFRNQRDHVMETLGQEIIRSGGNGPDELRRRLEGDSAAFDDLIGALTIGETYFFRDEQQFRLIKECFLPEIDKTQPANHPIRIWSAGCASGEEAWSIAVTLAEAGLESVSHILATDISRPSLQRARAGRYRAWSLRGAGKERMKAWINKQDDRYVIHDRLRKQVAFEYLNLSEDRYPSFSTNTIGLDLIICRNVLIYFDVATIQKVAERFFRCLRPGGWLLTGASDPLLASHAPFETLSTPHGLVCVRPNLDSTTSTLTSSKPDVRTALGPVAKEPRLEDRSQRSTVAKDKDVLLSQPKRPSAPAKKSGAEKHSIAEKDLTPAPFNKVVQSSTGHTKSADLCVLRVRALANLDTEQAVGFRAESCDRYPTNIELHYLHTILLTELGLYQPAADAARRVIFLDRELIVGHMAVASAHLRMGDTTAARRSFRNAERLSQSRPVDEIVPLSDGENAGQMAEFAARQLALLDQPGQ